MPAACLRLRPLALALVLLLGGAAAAQPASAPPRPALTVTTVAPATAQWAQPLPAAGVIAAWQEAVVAAEGAGGRLVEVAVQVGDKVRKGQVLARLATETLQADLAQSRAGLAEAQAVAAEARANAARARELAPGGAISQQAAQQAYTAEATAAARVESVKARLAADELRLSQAQVLAPDDGVISARLAVVGGYAGTGQELFRLIRRERLEWRAEVPAAELGRLKPGLKARLTTPSGEVVAGTVRQVAPTVEPATRQGLVYVDLAPGGGARAGMHARGEFVLGERPALVLPQAALVARDGFQYVLEVGADQRVRSRKVQVGRRLGGEVEILSGLGAQARVVAAGGAFLTEGDLVKVVGQAPALPSGSPAAPQAAASR
ncbi:efflux RND transporter periplasmic adaptor subunit [Ideonella livida]|uniref:Efflux RND transporter periplasmic adaptor subunit n=1 Tax=Ideonella livida TaxID=2707176 RepID=A0A7C9PGV3_9BURK|nr:efflux RND transporter periplasmic adaptor subunit [Ideonella livida]NDY91576.1 efflux RND transporter periplasmic adaptor subunit [Ideonella livida]